MASIRSGFHLSYWLTHNRMKRHKFIYRVVSLWSQFYHYNFCCRFCLNFLKTKQCDQSREARHLETEKLWKQLSSTVSRGTLPPTEMQNDISKCLYDVCGGCPGAGNIFQLS